MITTVTYIVKDNKAISHLGYLHTAPDEFSTGWTLVRLGVPFSQNHADRTKI